MSGGRWIVALLAAAAGIAITVSLGNWQTRRGDQKLAVQSQWQQAQSAAVTLLSAQTLDAVEGALPSRVRASGRFVPHATVYLDNRLRDGVPGLLVISAFEIADGAPWVLVNRGWLRRDRQRDPLRLAPPPAGEVTIEGLAVAREPRLLELGDPTLQIPGIWQNLDYDRFAAASKHRVARLVVQQTSDSGDGLRRDWPAPAAGVDKHRGYAFQWYALAALIAVLTLVLSVRALARRR